MNSNLRFGIVFCLSLVSGFTGCSHNADANSELEKATKLMQKAEPAAAQAQPSQPAQATPVASVETAPPAQQMNQAMVAYKAGNLEDAVTRLQRLRATPVMSPQQRIALNDAMGAVMTEIYALAAKGDSKAQMAVKQYEKMQTGGH